MSEGMFNFSENLAILHHFGMISIGDAFCNMYNEVMERDSEATSLASEMSNCYSVISINPSNALILRLILERILWYGPSFWKWYPHQNNTKYQTPFSESRIRSLSSTSSYIDFTIRIDVRCRKLGVCQVIISKDVILKHDQV